MGRLIRSIVLSAVVLLSLGKSQSVYSQQADDIDWMDDITSRTTFNGYAQAGWAYEAPNDVKTNSYNLKRTLLWAKARITDRWSFLFMHDFSSVPQEFYTDYRVSNDKSLNVRFGQFKHSYTPASLRTEWLGGFPVVWIVSLVTQKMNRGLTNKIFECYNEK